MKSLIVLGFILSLSLFSGDKVNLDAKKVDKSEVKMRVSVIGELTDDIKGKCGYHIADFCLGLDHNGKLKKYLGYKVLITGDLATLKAGGGFQSSMEDRLDLLNIEIKYIYQDFDSISGDGLDGVEVTVYGLFDSQTKYIGNFNREMVYVFGGFHISVNDLSKDMLSKINNKTVYLKGKLKSVNGKRFPAKSSKDGKIYEPYVEPSRLLLGDLEIVKVE